MRIFNKLDTFRLLGAIDLRSPFGRRDHCLLKLAMHTGLSISELTALDMRHVSLNGMPRENPELPAPLARRFSFLSLSAVARRVIAELLAFYRSCGLSLAPEAPLCQNHRSQRLTPSGLRKRVGNYRSRLAKAAAHAVPDVRRACSSYIDEVVAETIVWLE